MSKTLILTLMLCGAFLMSGCDRMATDEPRASDSIGKKFKLTSYMLVLDLHPGNHFSKSPTAQAKGIALSLDTLTSCSGCNYYQGGRLRQLLVPGTEMVVSNAYKAVPPALAIGGGAVDYYVVNAGTEFSLPEYEFDHVTSINPDTPRAEVLRLERLLQGYQDHAQRWAFFVKVQPGWIKHGMPDLQPPYSKEAVADYFAPLVAALPANSYSKLDFHLDEFFISLEADRAALATIILYSEGLKLDIIPAYDLTR